MYFEILVKNGFDIRTAWNKTAFAWRHLMRTNDTKFYWNPFSNYNCTHCYSQYRDTCIQTEYLSYLGILENGYGIWKNLISVQEEEAWRLRITRYINANLGSSWWMDWSEKPVQKSAPALPHLARNSYKRTGCCSWRSGWRFCECRSEHIHSAVQCRIINLACEWAP